MAPRDPPHATAPALARTHWAGIEEAGAMAGIWFLYGLHRLFGRTPFRAVLVPVVAYFVLRRGLARRASREYLERVGQIVPGQSFAARWWRVARHFHAFSEALLDKALAWSGALALDRVRVEVEPPALEALQSGRGGLMVVAHMGNLEVLRALGHRLRGLRMHVLVHTKHTERFNRLLERLDPGSAAHLVQVTELDAAMAARLSAAVERGEWVVIAADRVPVNAAPRVTWVPFLGRPAPLPTGPWVLAAALQCPVLWLQCIAQGARYTLTCELFAERVELPRARRAQALAEVAARFAARLERSCRAAPYAWFNFYPFWADPTDPGPEG